ncbi:hypothetical protein MCOR16_001294 [Pyricularia oryzae]|nr:hypothetical protein MCOR15_002236 [Pyricularia oryzae]KAI6539521.1 hypothetical protein MCOR16_001294 [Pyricularia oryzae]
MQPNLHKQRTTADVGELRATWLGHACYLVEFPSGLRVLFDPVMTDRCSPVSFLGPKRFTKAPCTIGEIPIVDLVVISHNHYDHMSYPTIAEIHKHHPHAHFLAPLGNADWFRSCGITAVTELDWWQEADVMITGQSLGVPSISARLTCLPAQHNSGRTPFNTDRTLWASWAVGLGGAKVFFAGDTGYRAIPHAVAAAAEAARVAEAEAKGKTEVDADFEDEYYDSHVDELPPPCPAFAQIGELHGPFALGLLPIGAYEPRGLMASIHASPADAVEIFRDTRCGRGLAMHWGTWVMGDEDVRDPPRRLRLALARKGMPAEGLFDVCKLGETVTVPVGPPGGQ